MEPGGYIGGGRPAACVLSDGGGFWLTNWVGAVWIFADFVVGLGKDAKKVPDAFN